MEATVRHLYHMKLSFLLLVLTGFALSTATQPQTRQLTETQIKAVIQAVTDEIYDYGLEGEFYQIGENVGTPKHWKSRLRIYVNPKYDENEAGGEAIYKIMPYGEVLRFFSIREDGMVELDGDPHNRFPLTQPSHQTVYDDDEDVCQMKHNWRKRFFIVDTAPSPEMVQEAVRRQKQRTGFSDWEFRHSSRDKKPNK